MRADKEDTRFGRKHLSTIVNDKYWIDSCWTLDHGFESMVFACEGGRVMNWGELDVLWADSEEQMQVNHETLCHRWEEV